MVWLIIGYMYLYIHRPFEVWPILGDLRLELLYTIAMCGYWLVAAKKQWLPNVQHRAFFAFALAALTCWLVSPWPDSGAVTMDRYYKLLVFYVILVTSVRDEKDLKRLLIAYLVIMTIYMLHSLRSFAGGRHHFRMGIMRLVGVDESFCDPNAFGASVLNSLAFVVPLWFAVGRRGRALLACYTLLAMACIGLTGSRTSFAGLVLLVGMICLASKRRWLMVTLACVLAPIAFLALPPSLQTRFETIINPSVGPANAAESTQGRVAGVLVGCELFNRFPLTGCGPGAWKPASKRDLESHNLFGQVMGEMGLLGMTTLAFVLLAYAYNVRRIARAYRQHVEWQPDFLSALGTALGFLLILQLFEGMAGHNLFRASWLWYGGFLVITRHCVAAREAQPVRRVVPDWAPLMQPSWNRYAH